MASQRTYYDVLGLEPGAPPDEVRAAFRRLARERHPDRFRGAERANAEVEFQQITEAYNVLADDARRSRYDQQLASPSRQPPTSPRDVARALVGKAVGLLKLGENAKAGELLGQAVAHDPQNARGRHLYGMFLAHQGGRLEEGLRQIEQAARLNPLNLRVLLDASRLFAMARMFARSSRYAQMAAELSPGDPAVESWLRQLEDVAGRPDSAPLRGATGGGKP
ncbi:MAG: DnaJ domain-containing protein [Acidobacteriota bacterium]